MQETTTKTPGFRLTPRDRSVLEAIGKMGELDRQQIQDRFFGSTIGQTSVCKHRLKALHDAGLIVRQKQLLVFGQGDKPAIYSLSIEGAHLLGLPKRTRSNQRGGFVLEHHRLAKSLLLQIERAAIAEGWGVAIEPEPQVRKALGTRDIPKPDGRFYITVAGKLGCGLLECDLGNEAKKKFTAKVNAYLDAFDSKALQGVHASKSVRVLIVTQARQNPMDWTPNPEADDKRADEILKFIREAGHTGELFWVTTAERFQNGDPLTGYIWHTASSPAPKQLIKE